MHRKRLEAHQARTRPPTGAASAFDDAKEAGRQVHAFGQVKATVGVALGGDYFAAWTNQVLKKRNAKGFPEKVTRAFVQQTFASRAVNVEAVAGPCNHRTIARQFQKHARLSGQHFGLLDRSVAL